MAELYHARITSTGTALNQTASIKHITAAGANNSDGRLVLRDTPSGRTLVDIDTGKDQAFDLNFVPDQISAQTGINASTMTNIIGATIWYS